MRALGYLLFAGIAGLAFADAAHAAPDRDLGSSVRHNVAVQIANPYRRFRNTLTEGGDGERAVDSLTRYRTGKLKPLLKANGKSDLGGQGGAVDAPTVAIPLIQNGPN